MHAEGKVKVTYEEDGLSYLMQDPPPEGFKNVAIACYLMQDDAEHIAALWNAANGMTTKRATELLLNGGEMQVRLEWVVGLLMSTGMHPSERKEIEQLITKLEVK